MEKELSAELRGSKNYTLWNKGVEFMSCREKDELHNNHK